MNEADHVLDAESGSIGVEYVLYPAGVVVTFRTSPPASTSLRT